MFNPISTYRIQFHVGFTFKDFENIIPYLNKLGVKTIYASPILEAVPGSMHGYDTINPHRVNPEIGTLEELRSISKKLQSLNIGWIQDIVPNHMAFHPGNSWLMDVLELGPASAYGSFFDINWSGDKDRPLMVPFLGATLEEAIENGDLKLVERGDKLKLKYHETEWPVNAKVKTVDMPLKEAADLQYYRLCTYRETDHQINFRRFFTVNDLICLNMQHPQVFDVYHEFIKSLIEEGIFQGLRIDHIDGLYDPGLYFRQLREMAGKDTYIIIEKILEEGESLPVNWPVQGNTGYDFLAQVNNMLTDSGAKKEFTHFYEQLTGDDKDVPLQIAEKKATILNDYMAGELDNLHELFLELELAAPADLDLLKADSLKEMIGQLLIGCPVYRYYGNQLPLKGDNHQGLKLLFKHAELPKHLVPAAALLKKVLLELPENGNEAYNDRATQFYLRCMQFSGPLMAKGVEDTLMYTYNRFIAHNEVGDAPAAFGVSRKVIHKSMWISQDSWPLSLNGTSTHDTKRGEDVRARLNVLSDRPAEWFAQVKHWRKINSKIAEALSVNDEYFIYQTLVGSYPMPGMGEDDYPARLQAYLVKALREGKVSSSWTAPNESYEHCVKVFVEGLLDQSAEFWQNFLVFHRRIADLGIVNSLVQVILKSTCPGVPDVYQGTELWDLSLVDPDNRRPVDYTLREGWLEEIDAPEISIKDLWQERFSGKIKLFLLHRLLQLRKEKPELFESGAYLPLRVKGKFAAHVFAYARRSADQWLVVVLPLHLGKVSEEVDASEFDWRDTRVILPDEAPLSLKNLVDGTATLLEDNFLPLAKLFNALPFGLFELETWANQRDAGILLPVTSLPSAYGIGDFGSGAREFIAFLSRAGQRYWQLLPLNPIGDDQAFSPYSSVSGMAGNILLISPDLLAEEGLLEKSWLKGQEVKGGSLVDYKVAENAKAYILHRAYQNFTAAAPAGLADDFLHFCAQEKEWLSDFALFMVIKDKQAGKPWFNWEEPLRLRDPGALKLFAESHADEIKEVKWMQFIFFRQWSALRKYATGLGVKFYGDLPFYLSHDSAEVWSQPQYFNLDDTGNITGMAGVPPDYFNEDGQLWGMPVYRWTAIAKDGYEWWMKRIRKNMELYDLLRLDHFRAFADYWEVAAGETTAINGIWKKGPGKEFFEVLRAEFPGLPFVAEDLGEINQGVYDLRDQFELAGMKVLQFAFGKDMTLSAHIPHRFQTDNFVVYTGTHDNDTTIGWFDEEAGPAVRKNLEDYTGLAVSRKNIHRVLSRVAYASVAKTVILPMQDVLGLGGESRINKPASVGENWAWRMEELPGRGTEKRLRLLARLYGRI